MDTEWEAEGSHPQISLGVPDHVGKLGPQEDGRISSLAPMSLLLRSQLAVIPQEPFLFSGTVRENLDPQGLHEDRALWQALEQCHLSEVAMAIGGLDGELGERGRDLSLGQRQLLCLARALLTDAKVRWEEETSKRQGCVEGGGGLERGFRAKLKVGNRK